MMVAPDSGARTRTDSVEAVLGVPAGLAGIIAGVSFPVAVLPNLSPDLAATMRWNARARRGTSAGVSEPPGFARDVSDPEGSSA
ncbi:hypothetical protein ACFTWF_02960, partial [Rhodococcus sp. NPDC056960]|uniref:hypothetical protein n=1 Tax=Rhodococcus sp. NPDC056960 TaxID=3345982 RepID=UPI003636BCC3